MDKHNNKKTWINCQIKWNSMELKQNLWGLKTY